MKDFISSSDVLHSLLYVSWHFANDTMVFVHGVASATPQGLGYLRWHLCHLQYQEKSDLTFAQVFPRAHDAECFLPVFD
jgi:hypothetical protein